MLNYSIKKILYIFFALIFINLLNGCNSNGQNTAMGTIKTIKQNSYTISKGANLNNKLFANNSFSAKELPVPLYNSFLNNETNNGKMIYSPDGKYAYIIANYVNQNGLSGYNGNSVDEYKIDDNTGIFTFQNEFKLKDNKNGVFNDIKNIEISANGKYFYATSRAELNVYGINNDGSLNINALFSYFPQTQGEQPVINSFTISPNGNYIYEEENSYTIGLTCHDTQSKSYIYAFPINANGSLNITQKTTVSLGQITPCYTNLHISHSGNFLYAYGNIAEHQQTSFLYTIELNQGALPTNSESPSSEVKICPYPSAPLMNSSGSCSSSSYTPINILGLVTTSDDKFIYITQYSDVTGNNFLVGLKNNIVNNNGTLQQLFSTSMYPSNDFNYLPNSTQPAVNNNGLNIFNDIALSSDGKYIYTSAVNSDDKKSNLRTFSINNDGTLTQNSSQNFSKFQIGALTFNSVNNQLYVADCNLSGQMQQFEPNGTPMNIIATQLTPTAVTTYKNSQDNSYLYVTSTNEASTENQINEYAIQANGSLVEIGSLPTGTYPINVVQNNGYLYVANFLGRSISQYSIKSDGTLNNIGTIEVRGLDPNSLAFPSLAYCGGNKCIAVLDQGTNTMETFLINADGTLSKNISTNTSLGASVPSSILYDKYGQEITILNSDGMMRGIFSMGASTIPMYMASGIGCGPNNTCGSTTGFCVCKTDGHDLGAYQIKDGKTNMGVGQMQPPSCFYQSGCGDANLYPYNVYTLNDGQTIMINNALAQRFAQHTGQTWQNLPSSQGYYYSDYNSNGFNDANPAVLQIMDNDNYILALINNEPGLAVSTYLAQPNNFPQWPQEETQNGSGISGSSQFQYKDDIAIDPTFNGLTTQVLILNPVKGSISTVASENIFYYVDATNAITTFYEKLGAGNTISSDKYSPSAGNSNTDYGNRAGVVSPDGKYLYILNSGDNTISMYAISQG